uniref:Chromosome 22 open reading frame 15 n=1 Tax=Saimiri boliviensis boliviensis TaxID=39432 RepID=A0A2K6STB0_SAIBB
MFIKVMFGAGSFVLVNTSCRLVNLTAHLRQKAGLLPDVTLALLAEDGNLVSLEDLKEAASGAPTMGSSLLKERATYVLVRISSKVAQEGEGMAPTRYESLLEKLDDQYPELAGANRQQPSRTPLAESGNAEKLHQQEGQGP